MYYFYFDASALVKRYIPEAGSHEVNILFAHVPRERLMCLAIGAAEVFSICVRKRNDGRITKHQFDQAVGHLNHEVIDIRSDFETIPAQNPHIWASIELMDIHSLNSVDAILLRSALDVATNLRVEKDKLVIVASDQRLLRAAHNEGLLVFNPETDTQETLSDFLQ